MRLQRVRLREPAQLPGDVQHRESLEAAPGLELEQVGDGVLVRRTGQAPVWVPAAAVLWAELVVAPSRRVGVRPSKRRRA